MENNKVDQKQKKGFLATIWESMNKTGGCCGSGGNCCGPSQSKADKQKAEQKPGGRTLSSGG